MRKILIASALLFSLISAPAFAWVEECTNNSPAGKPGQEGGREHGEKFYQNRHAYDPKSSPSEMLAELSSAQQNCTNELLYYTKNPEPKQANGVPYHASSLPAYRMSLSHTVNELSLGIEACKKARHQSEIEKNTTNFRKDCAKRYQRLYADDPTLGATRY